MGRLSSISSKIYDRSGVRNTRCRNYRMNRGRNGLIRHAADGTSLRLWTSGCPACSPNCAVRPAAKPLRCKTPHCGVLRSLSQVPSFRYQKQIPPARGGSCFWCGRWDLNPYACAHAPQTCLSANSSTAAQSVLYDAVFELSTIIFVILRQICRAYRSHLCYTYPMQRTEIIHLIPPFYRADSHILILGSFPSVKSREQRFFTGIRKTGSGR